MVAMTCIQATQFLLLCNRELYGHAMHHRHGNENFSVILNPGINPGSDVLFCLVFRLSECVANENFKARSILKGNYKNYRNI